MGALYNNGWNARGIAMGANPVTTALMKPIDVTRSNGFSMQFEITAAITVAAQVEFWAIPANADGTPNTGAAYQITEADLCDITGASVVVDAVSFPTTLAVGTILWARPRNFPEKWMSIKGSAVGTIASISAVAVTDRLK